MIQYVNGVLPGLGTVDTFSNERKDLTSCSAEAPLPPRVPREIPNETVKALFFCLVLATFLATATLAVIAFLAQAPAGPRSTMFLRKI